MKKGANKENEISGAGRQMEEMLREVNVGVQIEETRVSARLEGTGAPLELSAQIVEDVEDYIYDHPLLTEEEIVALEVKLTSATAIDANPEVKRLQSELAQRRAENNS